jgi:hypothetical protein
MDDPGYRVVEGVFSPTELAPVIVSLDGELATIRRA